MKKHNKSRYLKEKLETEGKKIVIKKKKELKKDVDNLNQYPSFKDRLSLTDTIKQFDRKYKDN